MKQKLYFSLLTAEAAFCVAFCLLQASAADLLGSALTFPFRQIAAGLRALSLLSAPGNALAVTLYVGFCSLPALFLWITSCRRPLAAEDSLPALLTPLLFVVMYLMINPGRLNSLFLFPDGSAASAGAGLLPVRQAVCCGLLWSILTGYPILRALRRFLRSGQDALWRYLDALLLLLAAVFVLGVFGFTFGSLVKDLAALSAGNTASGSLLPDRIFLFLRFLVESAPYVLNVFTVLLLRQLIGKRRADAYSQETMDAANRLCRFCAVSLGAVISGNILYQVLQLLCGRLLRNVHSTLSVPVTGIGFLLGALLLSRLLEENRRLKADNDLFI